MNESLSTFKCVPKVMIFEEIKFEDNLSLLHVTDGMVAMLKAIMQTHGTYWRTWSVCPTVSDITYMSEVESLYMYFGVWQSVLDQWHVLYSSTICLYPHEGTSTFRHCCKVYEISGKLYNDTYFVYLSNYVRSTTDPYTVRHTFWDCV